MHEQRYTHKKQTENGNLTERESNTDNDGLPLLLILLLNDDVT